MYHIVRIIWSAKNEFDEILNNYSTQLEHLLFERYITRRVIDKLDEV